MKKKLAVLFLCVSLAFVAAGTGWSKDNADITVVVMPKLVSIPYFNAAQDGAEKCGADLGIKVIYAGPTEADATQQYRMVEDFIAQGVDAIAVAPNDPAGLTPVLRKAKEAGIVVLDWDTAAEKDAVDYSIHNTDDREMGEHMWQRLFEAIGKEEGKYAILTGGLEAENLNTWIDYGLAWAEKNHPGIQLVTEKIPTNEKQQEAYSKALDLLKAYPDLDGIMGQSTPTPIGAGQAIQELGLQDKVSLVGHTMPKDAAQYLKDGSIDTGVLWNVYDLGYLAAYIAYTKVTGGEIKDGMEVPNIGKIEVREDGKTIILGPPLDITAGNVDSLQF
jgi:simple sugar transport system substrate-binding protein/rhamnose transport system substrate-binding protein